ncbi:MAG: hypothetical protein WC457_01595 [Patescibacteria group bacterium]
MSLKFKIKILLVTAILIGGCFVARAKDLLYSASQDIDVSLRVTSSTEEEPEEPPGGGPTDTNPPVISNVSSTVNFTTSTVSWTAVDDNAILNCTFYYGESTAYGHSATVAGSGSSFYADLSGLLMGTDYYFLISCLDTYGNPGTATGMFSTLASEFKNNLIILAKPEKRVPKTGGNYDMGATLRLYDSTTKALAYSTDLSFGATGSTTISGNGIPVGTYDAMLKGEAHLAKRIINVNIVNGSNTTLDFTQANTFYLYTGDVQGTGLKDNFVDILDVSKEDIEFNSSQKIFDLNRDGAVDVLDISAVLTNFNMRGDAV